MTATVATILASPAFFADGLDEFGILRKEDGSLRELASNPSTGALEKYWYCEMPKSRAEDDSHGGLGGMENFAFWSSSVFESNGSDAWFVERDNGAVNPATIIQDANNGEGIAVCCVQNAPPAKAKTVKKSWWNLF